MMAFRSNSWLWKMYRAKVTWPSSTATKGEAEEVLGVGKVQDSLEDELMEMKKRIKRTRERVRTKKPAKRPFEAEWQSAVMTMLEVRPESQMKSLLEAVLARGKECTSAESIDCPLLALASIECELLEQVDLELWHLPSAPLPLMDAA